MTLCPYCALHPCPDPWQHARDDAANETTWRRRANRTHRPVEQAEAACKIDDRSDRSVA